MPRTDQRSCLLGASIPEESQTIRKVKKGGTMVLIANTRKYEEGLTKKVISEQGHLDMWRRAFQAERMTCARALGWEQT